MGYESISEVSGGKTISLIKNPSTYQKLKECFPMPTMRQEQEFILKKVAKALKDGKKYIIIEAPPGVGKSPIAITLCKYFKKGYICTDQKSLQEQYLNDEFFPKSDMIPMIGRSNFVCKQASMDVEPGEEVYCNRGLCDQDDAFKCPGTIVAEDPKPFPDPRYAATSASRGPLFWKPEVMKLPALKCNYWIHKTKALNTNIVINNYSYLLLEGNYVGDFGTRPVLISDEGHNIEKHIMNFVSVVIPAKMIAAFEDVDFPYIEDKKHGLYNQKSHPQDVLMPKWIEWLKNVFFEKIPIRIKELSAIKSFFVDTTQPPEITKVTDKEGNEIEVLVDKDTGMLCPYKVPKACGGKSKKEIIDLLMGMVESLGSIHTTISFFLADYDENPKNWIIQPVQEDSKIGSKIIRGEFKPIRVSKYAKDKYFRFGEINVIMSATILNFDWLTRDLGIKGGEYAVIKVPPVFKKESNKLYHLDVCNLSHKESNPNTDSYVVNMGVAVQIIDKILDKFPEHKGIIHCVTYPNMHFIMTHSKHAKSKRVRGHTPENRGEVLQKHLASEEPLVLCSPSMSEGVDLKFDNSRFQIILKIPYPYSEDLQIKERTRQEPEFYTYKTALYLVQAIGRSVRTEDDWAYTFTIDTRFNYFCTRNASLLENFNRYERPRKEGIEFLNTPPLKKEASD